MKSWSLTVVVLCAIAGFAWYEWQPWINPAQDSITAAVTTNTEVKELAPLVAQADSKLAGISATGSAIPFNSGEHRQIRAKLSPVNFTNLASEIDAKVSDLPFKEGQVFAAGDVLVKFDCDLQQAKLEKVRAELEIAQRNFEANSKLMKSGSVSRLDALNSESELNMMMAQARELEILMAKCIIRAPYAGKVAESRVRREQFVQVGQPLLEILDDSRLELEFIVPSSSTSWLKEGYPFEVRVEETNQSYPARIERIGARIDPVSQTIKVVGAIDGTHGELIAGMSGDVVIEAP